MNAAGRGRRLPALLLALALAGPAQAGLELDGKGLTAAETAASQALLDEARRRLPAGMAAALPAGLAVRWSDALGARVHGVARDREVLLNARLLGALAGRDGEAGRDGAGRMALAALLHELAHHYDRATGRALSRDPRLLDLAGWQVRATRLATRTLGRRENRMLDRSPDPYELSGPREFLAVNVEHFLLDPQYACRRPALYRHLAQRLGAPPLARAPCAGDYPFADAGGQGGEALAALDPARVYGIDYLLAEPNAQPMSRWGHSMLRLVVCAPGRAPGPDCRLDLAHHRVLSFRAFVGDLQISSWRGLAGRYPSRLFVLPLEQVVDEYTRVELRGLRSIPLRLRRDEVAGVVERAAQLHWSYDGRYYFLSNNCAVETYRLLREGAPRLAGLRLESVTPTALLRRLQRAGIADASVLDDPAQALRLGYRFDSLAERFDRLYAVAKRELALAPADARGWMDLAPERRRPWLQRGDARATAALLVLEQAALRRQQLRAQDALKRRYLGRDGRALPAQARVAEEALRRLLEEGGYFGRPASLLDTGGYGLPQAEERAALAAAGTQRRERWRQAEARLQAAARDLLPAPQRAALDGIQANADLLGRRLRELHRADGGLRLR
ncbi:DUF4105 domain-containing protein [Vulcaniibacterium tengchongense]|uniref:Uncharacterized protein DUF4105 n=1 Tax=Vulcaniibacterium tengchongense TaxID=1273429 RepID=A0A3N4VS06_9GAMM|nr:DUF4105 domain-containing protein [Vulcaniibacterium tengchongense]RPE81991.1 uncharacterized protein DUF4105 [Vulcaniibacterium tengchongense]